MKLLVDTNILIDFIRDRGAFGAPAAKLMMLGYLHELDLWISSSQVTDLFFILSEGGQKRYLEQAKSEIQQAKQAVRVYALNEFDIDRALESNWDDFEDACLHQAALGVGADAIITRNQKDFRYASVKVFDCEEFFAYLQENKGICYGEIAL